MTLDLDRTADLARRLAAAARAETLPRFRSDLAADDKTPEADFDPVTEADRASEAAIRAILATEAPDDAIMGEEQAASEGRSGLTWVIDPIDGTRAYISGLPTWGTLIALDDGRRGVLGLVDHPWTDECFLGVHGQGATLSRAGETRPITVRNTRDLAAATMMTTALELIDDADRPAFDRLKSSVRMIRYGMDCYGYAMVAAGQIDLVVESGLQAYDIAAPKALVEAAGGVVTNWLGGDCRWGGKVIAAATPELAEAARTILSAG
ncbi:MAG: inositol monophosphatase family protein [Pseudomonadota bacterium]